MKNLINTAIDATAARIDAARPKSRKHAQHRRSVSITAATLERLRAFAARQGSNPTAVLERQLRKFLDEQDAKRTGEESRFPVPARRARTGSKWNRHGNRRTV